LSATAVGQETEVADAHEAWGEHVEEKAPQELVHRQGHQSLLVGVGGVSPAKGDLVAGERDEAVVGQNRPSNADC
jgi:hypothetical protein